MWLGFPSHAELWEDNLRPAQAEVAALALVLAGPGRERVRLMVCGEAALAAARSLIGQAPGIEVVCATFGDIWLRDTGPVFTGSHKAAAFAFNGWGERYDLPGDREVADQIATASGAEIVRHDFVLEGGALDHDGQGTVLTTRQCLLNANRNPGWTEAKAEAALARTLGARRVVWLDEGLINDHTDGHVDNLARFVAPGVVACPVSSGRDDPHKDVYRAAAEALAAAGFSVISAPSPGRVSDEAGGVIPASHMNFLIANGAVIVPIYDQARGEKAVQALATAFPGRQVIGLSSRALISGGGSFHCISQQQPG